MRNNCNYWIFAELSGRFFSCDVRSSMFGLRSSISGSRSLVSEKGPSKSPNAAKGHHHLLRRHRHLWSCPRSAGLAPPETETETDISNPTWSKHSHFSSTPHSPSVSQFLSLFVRLIWMQLLFMFYAKGADDQDEDNQRLDIESTIGGARGENTERYYAKTKYHVY